jgi:DNA-binding MarR family transcriptional regulator
MKPNEIIHQSTRLRIMASLNVLEPGRGIEFARLRSLVQTTDGNLGAHLETLAQAGYVAIDKSFVNKKPLTRARATSAGRQAFAAHVAYLRALLGESVRSEPENAAQIEHNGIGGRD